MGRNIGYIYGLLIGAGINTNGMSPEEAYITWNELQNKAKIGTTAEKAKLKREYGIDLNKIEKKSNLTNEEKRLQELTGEKVEHEPTDEEKKKQEKPKKKSKSAKLKDKVKKQQPVVLNTKGKKIIAEFDEGTARKNLFDYCNSDEIGFRYKVRNINKWRELIASSLYLRKDNEREGKKGIRHKGTDEWLYFTKKHETEKYIFNILINIRKQNKKYYVDELAFKTKYVKKKKASTKVETEKK